MKTIIGCFEFRDEGIEPQESADLLNQKLQELEISADDVISIMQPTDEVNTRVYYKKRSES